MEPVKGATKSYFTHYSCVIIVLFNAGLCRFVLSTNSSEKLGFRLSVFFVSNQIFRFKALKFAATGIRKVVK